MTTGLIIGSTALRHHFPDFPREAKDFDLWSPLPAEMFMDTLSDLYWDERMRPYLDATSTSELNRFATPDELLTMKISHSPWELKNGSWLKHMHDIVWLQDHGAKFDNVLYGILYPIWEDLHGKKPVNLNQDASMFFADAVKRIYVHDSIHYSVAYTPGHPIYEDVFVDGQDVAMDMNKVWRLDFDTQIRLFREEIYATALERWVIPRDYEISPKLAYAWALRKTITSLTKGRSALFMIQNYKTFRDPDMDYVAHHLANAHYLEKL